MINFKNYELQSATFGEQFNIVVGLNGMGKTNLLDAIYYLCIGKSYFTSRDINVKNHGKEFFRLEGSFDRKGDVQVFIIKAIPGKSKEIIKNNTSYERMIDHVGYLPVVIISPRDIQLFYEGSAERRKFLDYSISQYDKQYLLSLTIYNKLLKQRNSLLKQAPRDRNIDVSLLYAYNEKMIEPGSYISMKRKQFIDDISPLFNKCYASISGDAEDCKCFYKSQLIEGDFRKLLETNEQKDRILQRTTVGIHKDDLEFEMNANTLKTFGSQGQLKSFVLALKLAQYEMLNSQTEVKPILLLDDLFDRLDNKRIMHLLKMLSSDTFGQVFISDTHEDKLKALFAELKLDYSCFKVEDGTILNDEKTQ